MRENWKETTDLIKNDVAAFAKYANKVVSHCTDRDRKDVRGERGSDKGEGGKGEGERREGWREREKEGRKEKGWVGGSISK